MKNWLIHILENDFIHPMICWEELKYNWFYDEPMRCCGRMEGMEGFGYKIQFLRLVFLCLVFLTLVFVKVAFLEYADLYFPIGHL